MKIEYFELTRVITITNTQCMFVGEIKEKDESESDYGPDWVYLICPAYLVDTILNFVDTCTPGNKLFKAVKKKLATGRPDTIISMNKFFDAPSICLSDIIIDVEQTEFEDDEFNDDDDEKYYLIKSFK